MNRPRLILADDHRIFLDGLIKLLESEYEIVATVVDGPSLASTAQETEPDAIVTDISMPGCNGIEALRQIRQAGIAAKVILLTMHDDAEYAVEALQAGASGYVLKQSATIELQAAICEALADRVYITPMIAKDLIDRLVDGQRRQQEPDQLLSPRQRDILRLLVKGHSAKAIAKQLGISPRTVEYHKYRTMTQVGVQTTAELIEYAVKEKLLSD